MVSETKIDLGLKKRRVERQYFLEFFRGSNELPLLECDLARAKMLGDLIL